MAYFIYDNKKIYYKEIGNGKPLIFLHGNTASSAMFLEIVNRYTDIFKVILIDFLGHGKSDRLKVFPADLWFDEAMQVIAFLKEKQYEKVNIIGSSGGALVAINVALEAPELVSKIVADSFEGEVPLKEFTTNIVTDRELSKKNDAMRLFYQYMQGKDWESIVDNDTFAIIQHEKNVGKIFHRNLQDFVPDILMTGSKKDEFFVNVSSDYLENVYGKMLKKIGHGRMYLFDFGGHPAMLTNAEKFANLAKEFLK